MFTATNGPSRRALSAWSARVASSMPVPVGPRRSTGTSSGATRRSSCRTVTMGSLWPTMPRSSPAASWARPRCAQSTTRSCSVSQHPRRRSSRVRRADPTTGTAFSLTAAWGCTVIPPAVTVISAHRRLTYGSASGPVARPSGRWNIADERPRVSCAPAVSTALSPTLDGSGWYATVSISVGASRRGSGPPGCKVVSSEGATRAPNGGAPPACHDVCDYGCASTHTAGRVGPRPPVT
ncbi:MAG: hypothetical protein ACI8PZ_000924 [Myxococcota bacterium]|jgi:hypothetical protein